MYQLFPQFSPHLRKKPGCIEVFPSGKKLLYGRFLKEAPPPSYIFISDFRNISEKATQCFCTVPGFIYMLH